MQKFKFFTLAIIAMQSVNLAFGADPSIIFQATDLGGTNNKYELKSGTAGGVNYSSYSYTNQTKYQFNGDKGKNIFFNTSPMPGAIKSIKATKASNTDRSVTAYVSKTALTSSNYSTNGTSLGAQTVTSSGTTWTLTDEQITAGYKYFYLHYSTTSALYVSQFEVTYAAAATYTVNYTLNSGTHGTNHPTSGTIGTAFAVSAPTRSGYTFTGWTVTSGLNTTTAKWGTTSSPSTSLTSSSTKCVNGTSDVYFKDLGSANGSVTLTANWQEKAKYTVTFNAGSGTCSTSSLTESTAGAGVTLPAAAPSSACGTEGWTFAGWAAASQTETTTAPTLYAASSNYKPSSNCTLYAVYSKTESGGGGGSGVDQIVKSDWGTQGTSGSGSAMSVTTGHGIVVSSTKGYYGGDNTYAQFYANDVITITPASGMTITQIVFTANGTSNNGWQGTNPSGVVSSNIGSISGSSTNVATTWTGAATSAIEVSHDKQMRLVTIDITYSGSGGTTTYNSNPSCAVCSNLITITKGTPSHGSFTLTGAGTDICADEPVTVTLSNITADTHYHATAVTTSATTGGGTPSAISAGSATVTGITASTTINVTFVEDTKVTVTLLNNNEPVNKGGFDTNGQKQYYTGETLGALPTLTSSDACDATSTTFMGWTSDAGFQKRAAAPSFVTSTTTVNDNMTLRAVWARGE